MKSVLIVEDEKMIRQGIKTMVLRSGVPVEMVLECNNGETALEILREHKIDVMFTDIRMPKLDGIQLVQKMQELEHIPLTVAISGYDDFSYAVEMMRHGVREYLLKPIERTKITEILTKLNEELEAGAQKENANRKIGIQQIKRLVLEDTISDDEMAALKVQYEKSFYQEPYRACYMNSFEHRLGATREIVYLPNLPYGDVFFVEEKELEDFLQEELMEGAVAISDPHMGIDQIRTAYEEAKQARREGFYQDIRKYFWCERKEKKEETVPEQMRQEAKKLTEESAALQRVQLLGTEKTEELEKVWKRFFFEVKKGRITVEEFAVCMQNFFADVKKTYRSVLEEEDQNLELENIWSYPTISSYEENMLEWLLGMQEGINSRFDANKNKAKIQMALEYMEQHYAEDLNMAVVSNYISMNYSLFSYSFKQYTGSNFVNYLKEIRMKEAMRLLRETDDKIIDISQKVGYENEKHFMKLFKASCGVSPSEYRKNTRCEK
ncbi:response regulator [Roseburia sp. 831b]|uniref:response regulator n=1 Tax=Roseburia sp. 831b TaxID=1261635 RepID=UPI0009513D84|nr:response regulator [Roseburia sp. 831b]WVK73627.1 response regulator [Roseburia sp. 831b]